jgi:predicted RNA-binding protein
MIFLLMRYIIYMVKKKEKVIIQDLIHWCGSKK